MKEIEVKLDKDELPSSSSGGTVFSNEDVTVVFLRGNTHNDERPAAIVYFKKLTIKITGGASLWKYLGNHIKEQWAAATLRYLFTKYDDGGILSLLNQMAENAKEEGHREGRQSFRDDLKKLFGDDF
jgi:hypothetical protein